MSATRTARWLGEETIFWKEKDKAETYLSEEDLLMCLARGTPRYGFSVHSGVRSLPPGSALFETNTHKQMRRFWTPLNGPRWNDCDEKMIANAIATQLAHSVSKMVGSSRKVGLFLSGGLDSTILAGLLRQQGVNVHAYVSKFPEAPDTDETRYAKLAADYFQIPLTVVEVRKQEAWRSLVEILEITDRPLMCWGAASQFAIAKRAGEDGCDLLLSGLGSDELFGGFSLMGRKYKAFVDVEKHAGAERAWSQLLGPPSPERSGMLFIGNASPFPASLISELFNRRITDEWIEHDVVNYYREMHRKYPDLDISAFMCAWEMEMRTSEMLWPDFKAASRLAGMDVCYPFFTADMLEWFTNIPMQYRFKFDHSGSLKHFPLVYNGIDKYILRLAFEDLLPVEIQKRERMAFTAPFAWWLQSPEFRSDLFGQISDSKIFDQMDMNQNVLKRLFTDIPLPNLLNQWVGAFQIFQLYTIARWAVKNQTICKSYV